jgi:uncharacterized Zn-binding protein involved in type VI secretion
MFTDFFRFLRKPEKTAYCMKCKAQHEIKKGDHIIMKNGRPATKGLCAACGTSVFRIESPTA